MRTRWFSIGLALSMALLSGCVTNVSKLNVDPHHGFTAPAAPSSGAQTAYLADVSDGRVFVDKTSHPYDPTPALASEEERAQRIGRKRDGYGKAWGGYCLEDGQTVQDVVRVILEDALAESGYNVLHDAKAVKRDTLRLDGVVTKFWMWIDNPFWPNLITDMAVRLKPADGAPFDVQIQSRKFCPLLMDSFARKSINNGIIMFRSAAAEQFRNQMDSRGPRKTR